ncbi:MAG: adenylate cyclase, partial [Candidatus Marinamargulisbacteria bacterium]
METNQSDIGEQLKNPKKFSFGFSFQLNMILFVVGTIAVVMGCVMIFSYNENSKGVLGQSLELIGDINQSLIEKTTHYLLPSSVMTRLGAEMSRVGVVDKTRQSDVEKLGLSIMTSYSQLTSFYFGDRNGDFVMVKRQPDDSMASKIIDRTAEKHLLTWTYYKGNGETTELASSEINYDPRERGWYLGAEKNRGQFWSDIYIFFTGKTPGITTSFPVYDSKGAFFGAFGVDIELSQLTHFLQEQKIGKTGIAFIFDQKNSLVAFSGLSMAPKEEDHVLVPLTVEDLNIAHINDAFAAYRESKDGEFMFMSNGQEFIGAISEFPEKLQTNWKIGTIVPAADFLGKVAHTNSMIFYFSIGFMMLGIMLSWIISKSMSGPIGQVAREVESMSRFDFNNPQKIDSHINEIQELDASLSDLRKTLTGLKKYFMFGTLHHLSRERRTRVHHDKKNLIFLKVGFSDITDLIQNASESELAVLVSNYFQEVATIIQKHDGLTPFINGQELNTIWENDSNEKLFEVCDVALACKEAIRNVAGQWLAEKNLRLHPRIGVHFGESLVGNFGTTTQLFYSVLGKNAELMSSIVVLNEVYGCSVMVSQEVRDVISEAYWCRPVEHVLINAKGYDSVVYEMIARKGQKNDGNFQLFASLTEKGLDCYLSQDWDTALTIYSEM